MGVDVGRAGRMVVWMDEVRVVRNIKAKSELEYIRI